MAKITDWTGVAGNGQWFDPGNWSAGVPGRNAAVIFGVFGQPTIDVSLAPAGFHHPVAGSVTVEAGAIVDAHGMASGGGVDVSSGTLIVHGVRATVSGTTLVEGIASASVGDGAHLPMYALAVESEDTHSAGLDVGGTGTLVRAASLTLYNSDVSVSDGARMVLTGGTLLADLETAQVLRHGVTLSGSGTIAAAYGGTLTLDGAVTGPKATLTIGAPDGSGTVVLANAADSYGRTDLAGGTLELVANDVTGNNGIRFLAGGNATLQVAAGVSVANTLPGFGAGDVIDLAGIAFGPRTTLDLMPRVCGGATLTVSDGTGIEHLVLGTAGNPAGYTLAADGHGGTSVSCTAPSPTA